jgi:NAD+ diphosphatase
MWPRGSPNNRSSSRAVDAPELRFCPRCRGELQAKAISGRIRYVCEDGRCGHVFWNNPVPVAAALVQIQGKYVLARNASWPMGVYSVLTGFIEEGEVPEIAAIRETEEELGVKVKDAHLIGHFALKELNQLIVAYMVEAAGEVRLAEELADVVVMTPGDLASFNFGPLELTREIVSTWLSSTGGGD